MQRGLIASTLPAPRENNKPKFNAAIIGVYGTLQGRGGPGTPAGGTVLGMAKGAPTGCAGVSQGPELAKPVPSHHGTHSHRTREPSGAVFEGELGLQPHVPRAGSSPADLPHLGARACDVPYSDLKEPHPASDHLLGQAICGDNKQTRHIHTHGNSDKKSH